jgi:hypothetical protein
MFGNASDRGCRDGCEIAEPMRMTLTHKENDPEQVLSGSILSR